MSSEKLRDSIAIIGMECRLPGASNLDELWDVLANGKETITHFKENELDSYENALTDFEQNHYIRSRGVLSDIDKFDAAFFGFSPREAANLDPQQRIWLEVAWNALERSGYSREQNERMVGVFTGSLTNSYLLHNLLRSRKDIEAFVRLRGTHAFSTLINNNNSFLATRTSYKLKLNGPSVGIQTACSTSLVAVVNAVQSLLNFESDICIAGGVNIIIPQEFGYFYHDGAIGSADGHCRPFDHRASGTVFGSGAGAVILKRWEDAVTDGDHILAVIRGAAINNDGARKVGYSAPSIDGQAEVISLAQSFAGVSPESISYIEAHGTGTPIGDPIEVEALKQVFGTNNDSGNYCGIGSIKGNIGHLDVASGIAGLIKVVLAIQNRKLPPSINFEKPNPKIDFSNSPFYVVTQLKDWTDREHPLRAGVSSFGVGGTNAHVVVEAPQRACDTDEASRTHQLLLLSAKTDSAVDQAARNLIQHIEFNPNCSISDIAYTLQTTRCEFERKKYVLCENSHDAAKSALQNCNGRHEAIHTALNITPKIIFLFPGQGSQYSGMGIQLYKTEKAFKKAIDECAVHADKYLDHGLKSYFVAEPKAGSSDALINNNALAQLAIFSVEYALTKLWESWGVRPSVVLGHSLGEWTAACVSGVISIKDAIKAIYHRGILMQRMAEGQSALSVWCSQNQIAPFLAADLSIAAINGPALCLISGPTDAIGALQKILETNEIKSKRLPISVAVHSSVLESAIDSFHEILDGITFSPCRIPMVSGVTGAWLSDDEALDTNYWASQMRHCVDYAKAIRSLLEDGACLFLEVGPGKTLSKLTQFNKLKDNDQAVLSTLSDSMDDEQRSILEAVGNLWMCGISLDWSEFYQEETRKITPLPTYPFERQPYWIDPPELETNDQQHRLDQTPDLSVTDSTAPRQIESGDRNKEVKLYARPALSTEYTAPSTDIERFLAGIWQEELGVSSIGINDSFIELGGDSLKAVQVMDRIKEESGQHIPLEALAKAETISKLVSYFDSDFKINPDWSSLVLLRQGSDPTRPYLFIPHGVNGNVHWGNIHLISNIDPEQTIYGFSVPKGRTFKSFSEMALHYIREMKELQPKGPYCLAGYCYGGALAYEIAYQLRSSGDDVAFLGLIEAWPTNTSYGKIKVTPLYLYRFIRNIPLFIYEFLRRPTDDKKRSIQLKIKRYKRIIAQIAMKIVVKKNKNEESIDAQHILLEEMFDVQELRHRGQEQYRTVDNNLSLQRQHIPKPCDIKAEVFRANRQPLFSSFDPTMGWTELALGGVISHLVPGSHHLISTLPYAEVASKQLSLRLKKSIEK